MSHELGPRKAALGHFATVASLFSLLESCCSADLKNKKVVKHDR
jgi:hypothetical protein